MNTRQSIINSGIISIGKDSRGHKRSNDFDHNMEIDFCESRVRIPYLNIDCNITWKGGPTTFGIKNTHKLTKGGNEMYVHIRGYGRSDTFKIGSFGEGCYRKVGLGVEDEFVIFEEIEGKKLEFTLLDKFKRDFSLNPFLNDDCFEVSLESLVEKTQSDFTKLLSDPTHSDVILQCKDGVGIKAHKIILISRSTFFKRMFECESLESKTNVVKCDFKSEIMKVVLIYLYSGKFEGKELFEIYEAADYYDLTELKLFLENMLIQEMDCSNIFQALGFAEAVNSSGLQQRTLAWITWSAKYVKESQEYLKLRDSASNCEFADLLKLVDEALNKAPIGVLDETDDED
ncbi:hypothetical protein ACFFRR_002670 [Megaselia abdita]